MFRASIRLRSTDSGGLSYEESFSLEVVMTSDDVVINEIHYNPPENPVRQEYIELHNATDRPIDLTGWYFTEGIELNFPLAGGPVLAPG